MLKWIIIYIVCVLLGCHFYTVSGKVLLFYLGVYKCVLCKYIILCERETFFVLTIKRNMEN